MDLNKCVSCGNVCVNCNRIKHHPKNVIITDLISIDIPEFEEIDKRWFTHIIPQYLFVIGRLLYGKSVTRENLVFSHKNFKFFIYFDYMFEYDHNCVTKLKSLAIDNIETIVITNITNITKDENVFDEVTKQVTYTNNNLIEFDKLKIETLVYQYVSVYFT